MEYVERKRSARSYNYLTCFYVTKRSFVVKAHDLQMSCSYVLRFKSVLVLVFFMNIL